LKKDFLVLDQQLAGLLMCLRHRLVTARPDINNKTKMVYFFNYDSNFEKDFIFLKTHKSEIEKLIKDKI